MESENGKLFVGGVSRDTSEEILKDYFAVYGGVEQALIIRDKDTGHARGFGFVTFSDPSVTDKVLQDSHVILGRTVDVKRARPKGEKHQDQHRSPLKHQNNVFSANTENGFNNALFRTKKIFVGGLPLNLTEEEFRSYFETFGSVTEVVVIYDKESGRPRGFGFITFDSEEAVDKVLQSNMHKLNNKLVEVKRAEPKGRNNWHMNNCQNNGWGFGGGYLLGGYGSYYSFDPSFSIYPAGPLPCGNAAAYYYESGHYAQGYNGISHASFSSVHPRGSYLPSHSPLPHSPAFYPAYINGGGCTYGLTNGLTNRAYGNASCNRDVAMAVNVNLNGDDDGNAVEGVASTSPHSSINVALENGSLNEHDNVDEDSTTVSSPLIDDTPSPERNNAENGRKAAEQSRPCSSS